MGSTGCYLRLCVGANPPHKQLPISAQAEQAVSEDKQLQNSVCVPLVAPMPANNAEPSSPLANLSHEVMTLPY